MPSPILLLPLLALLGLDRLGAAPCGPVALRAGYAESSAVRSLEEPGPALSPRPVRCKVGPRAILLDGDGRRVGVVREHRFDASSGELRELVVDAAAAGEAPRLVLLAYDELAHDVRRNDLILPGGAATLASRPTHDPSAVPTVAKSGGTAERSPVPGTLTCGELLAARVLGTDAPFGSVEDLLLEPREGRVAFVVVRPRSEPGERPEPKVIPWSALTWNTVRLEGSVTVGRWRSGLSRERLCAAPVLPGGDLSLLSDPDVRSRIRSYHAVGGPTRP